MVRRPHKHERQVEVDSRSQATPWNGFLRQADSRTTPSRLPGFGLNITLVPTQAGQVPFSPPVAPERPIPLFRARTHIWQFLAIRREWTKSLLVADRPSGWVVYSGTLFDLKLTVDLARNN